ncbi:MULTISPECIES: chemotaxis protein CheA [Shouchella]|uniref:Chemotaxis protein CheA n=1 Tax=Shouchella hunanensis TaxID=766894 RepID=A0ABY7W636_9BACI|nr:MULTISPECIES: chemotaxis protein CheA [Shouchella]WDF04071.1 chemotaxis protein CheA [Shouchella hunanensis]
MSQNRYVSMFIDESLEHLSLINEHLPKLAQEEHQGKTLDDIFRSAHTIKGMAASMNFTVMAELTHQFENVLDDLRSEKVRLTDHYVDFFYAIVDFLDSSIESVAEQGIELSHTPELKQQLDAINQGSGQQTSTSQEMDEHTLRIIEQAVQEGISVKTITVSVDEQAMLKGVRAYMVISEISKLGEILYTNPYTEALEEGLFEKTFQVVAATGVETNEIVQSVGSLTEITHVDVKDFTIQQQTPTAVPEQRKQEAREEKTQKSIRVQLGKLDELMYLFEELVVEKSRLEELSKKVDDVDLTTTTEKINRSISHLQSVMLSIRMMSLDTIFSRFPKMVRKIAKEVKKDIDFVIEGGETEIDKALIDELSDPLLHLLRNSIDHGIEQKEQRLAQQKKEKGTITLRAFYKGSRVAIEIEDDGGGINREKVLQKALKLNLLSEEEAMQRADEDIYQLLFQSGFSTAEAVTDLSGRGVGLDVVKTNLGKIGGTIDVYSTAGKGSTFSISLPLTVSIMEALLVQVDNRPYAIPVSAVLETATVRQEAIQYSQDQAMIHVRGQFIPLYSLQAFVGAQDPLEEEEWSVVVLYQKDKLVALRVDDFIGHSEIVLKTLGHLLKTTKGLLGATILGDGNIAMVVDTSLFFTNQWRAYHEQ